MNLSRNILEHWQELSSHGIKLLTWILLSARQARLEASYDDLLRGLGWSRKMLQRAVLELTQKGYIRVTLATNRRSKTLVEVLIDFEEKVSSVDNGVLTDTQESPAVDKGVHGCNTATAGMDKGVHSTAVGVDTGVLSTTQESVSGVPADPSLAVPQKSKPLVPPKYLAGELSAVAREVMAYVGFSCDREYLSRGFIVLLEKFGKRRPWPRPGVLGSQVINRCLYWQRKRRSEGKNPLLYAWPAVPNFQKHTAIVRRNEREAGKAESRALAVA